MEDIASGGTGIATVSVGNILADIIDYIDIITVILIFGVFITKVIAHIRKFIENK